MSKNEQRLAMSTRKLLIAAPAFMLMTFGAVCLAQSDRRQQPRPNIIFILVDDLRWDDLGIAGYPFVNTPNIDRIGREGALFRNAFMTTPLCSPSRASFLTGQYAKVFLLRLCRLMSGEALPRRTRKKYWALPSVWPLAHQRRAEAALPQSQNA